MEEIITVTGNRQKELDRSEELVKTGNLQEHEKHEQFMIGFYMASLHRNQTEQNQKHPVEHNQADGVVVARFSKESCY